MKDKEIVAFAQQLIQIPSTPAEGTRAIVDFLYGFLLEKGLEVEKQQVRGKKHWNILCWLPSKNGHPYLLLTGHLDTVPMGLSQMNGQIIGGKLYGRGAADMKGAIAAMVAALATIKEKGIKLPCSILFAGVAGEEIGGIGTKALLKMGVTANMAILGEPTSLRLGVAHKGVEWLKVTIIGKSAHASCPSDGINAILLSCLLIQRLVEWGAQRARTVRHPLLGGPTLNIGTIKGGSSPNVVPEKSVIQMDYRWVPGENVNEVVQQIAEISKTTVSLYPGATVRVERMPQTLHAIPFEVPLDHPVVILTQEALKASKCSTQPVTLPYATDASLLTKAGIPTVICGPGNIAQAHSAEEFIELKQLLKAFQLYLNVILLCRHFQY